MELKSFYKNISLSGFSTAIKILSGIIITKFVAIYSGPSGLAILSNLKNTLSTLTTLSAAGIDNGITKYISSENTEEEHLRIISSSFTIALTSSLVLFLSTLLFSSKLSFFISNTDDYTLIIRIFAFFIPLSAFNLIIVKYLNGLKSYTKIISINIYSNIINVFIAIPLIVFWGLKGAVLSFITIPVISFVVTILLTKQHLYFYKNSFVLSFKNNKYLRLLLSFSLISITATILTPITQLTIRKIIIHHLDLHHAGIWDAVNVISNNYFLFVSMTMSLLVLPEFSKATTKNDLIPIIKILLFKMYPLFLFGLTILYITRGEITAILFSKDFYDINHYVGIQFVGDAIKFIGWIFGIFLISKAQTKKFIIAEMFSAINYIYITKYLINFHEMSGIFYAYILNKAISLLVVLLFSLIFLKKSFK